jgi:hypothetical protein
MDSIMISTLGVSVPRVLKDKLSETAKLMAFDVYESLLERLYPSQDNDSDMNDSDMVEFHDSEDTANKIFEILEREVKDLIPEEHYLAILFWTGAYMALDGFIDFLTGETDIISQESELDGVK